MWIYILNKKIIYYARNTFKLFSLVVIAVGIIGIIVITKYKPVYSVEIDGQDLGYIENKKEFENIANEQINNIDSTIPVAFVNVEKIPQYELTFVGKETTTNEQEVLSNIKENSVVTYKLYAVTLEGQKQAYVNTIEEAETLVEQIKQEYETEELNIGVHQIYTEDIENIDSIEIEVAKTKLEQGVEKQIARREATVNGITLGAVPVDGIISSRYGSIDSVRSYKAHSGLDIAAPGGTDIKACAGGTVTYTGYYGGYGNLVKISHGNSVETYYAHCSKIYVSEGDTVEEGQVIAAVGSTGNSTGNHLHLEVRIDGRTVNPQKYLYK